MNGRRRLRQLRRQGPPEGPRLYEGLGFTPNPAFSNDDAASFTIAEGRHIHLLTHSFLPQFTRRPVSDLSSVWGTLAIGVDAHAQRVLDLGGSEESPPQDHGFMHGR